MNRKNLYIGSTWNPEQWPEDEQLRDVRLMQELGFNVVRIGEFAWARLEPREGEYATDWLERDLDLAEAHGVKVVLCTPTAGPPTWMFRKHPDIGYVEPDGYVHRQGGRQAADYCHADFRKYSRKIAEVVAERLGNHPSVIAWQIDNELRAHQKLSLSPSALAGWHRWLERRYGDIDALNHEWGTYVWGHRYEIFEDVPGPHPLPNYAHNHSLLTQFRRYMNDSVLEYMQIQIDAIRKYSDKPITHNSEDSLDEWDLFQTLDFAAYDCYTRGLSKLNIDYRNDCYRQLVPGRPFWVMETDAEGAMGEGIFPPGWLANFGLMSYGAGAEAVLYWPWRSNRTGSEIIGHNGPIYATGAKGGGWDNLVDFVALRDRLQPHLEKWSPAPASVAFVRAERNGHFYYLDKVAGLEPSFDFRGRLESHYQTLHRHGVWRDVLFDQAAFHGYRMVVSPYLPYMSPEFLEQIKAHLAAGGIWIVGPYTGYLNAEHANQTEALLGDLEKFLGIQTRLFVPFQRMWVTLAGGVTTNALMHGHLFELGEGEESLGSYENTRLQGLSWGLRKSIGAGTVYLLGSELEEAGRTKLYQSILDRESISRHAMPEGIMRYPQTDAEGNTAWALVNTLPAAQEVALPSNGVELLSGERVGGSLTLVAGGNYLVRFDERVVG